MDSKAGLKDDIVAALSMKEPQRVPVAPYVDYTYASKVSGVKVSEVVLGSNKFKANVLLQAYRRHRYNWIMVFDNPPENWQQGLTVKDLGDKYEVHSSQAGEKPFLLPKDGTAIYPIADVTVENAAEAFEQEIIDHEDILKQGRCELTKQVSASVGRETLVTAIVGAPFGEVLCRLGLNRAAQCLYKQPDLVRSLSELCLRRYVEQATALSEAGAEAFWVEEVFAGTDTISPQHYEELALPSEKALVEALQRLGKPVILYFCGNPMPIIQSVATTHADAYAFEEDKKGIHIDLERIKTVLDGHACLFGNFDTINALASNPREIEKRVKEMLIAIGLDRSFVLGTGSPLTKLVQPENLDAMITAARNYRRPVSGQSP
jgi:uroporphyrinogen-III decarboxylase